MTGENDALGDPLPADDLLPNDAPVGQSASGTPASAPKRFLAGATKAPRPPSLPNWMRVFFLAIALTVSLFILLSVLSWPVKSTPPMPVLVCVAVNEYAAAAIPPLAFSEQDISRVQRAALSTMQSAEFAEGVIEARSTDDFRVLFEQSLRTIDADTCVVVYVLAHGVVADDGEAYLLPAQTSATRLENGYPLRDLLKAMELSQARNKLLILDTLRMRSDLQMGLPHNDFVDKLRSEFAKIKITLSKSDRQQSFWVLSAGDHGQASWSSPALQGSPFALAVAYCLQGGREADLASLTPDGSVDVEELIDFVSNSVGQWSLENRDAWQRPLSLHFGQEFGLAPVDDKLTVASLLTGATAAPGEEQDAEASVVDTGDSPDEDSAEDAGQGNLSREPAQPKDGLTSARAAPTKRIQELNDRIADFWMQRQELAGRPEVMWQPVHWNAFQQSLLRAEGNLLLGKPAAAARILDQSVEMELKALQASAYEFRPNWSLAFAGVGPNDELLQTEKLRVEQALAQPTNANLARLNDFASTEAALIRVLGDFCRKEETWIDADTVRLAIDSRTLAHSTLPLNHPEVLEFVRDRVSNADLLRRRAENELILGHSASARTLFQSAGNEYRRAISASQTAADQLDQIQDFLICLPFLIEWLGDRPPRTAKAGREEQLLSEFLHSFKDFIRTVRPSQGGPTDAVGSNNETKLLALQKLADLAAMLKARALRYGIESLQPTDWQQSASVLKLPFLDPLLRRRLVDNLVALDDTVNLDPSGGSWRPDQSNAFGDDFPLADFFGVFGPEKEEDRALVGTMLFREQVRRLREEFVSDVSQKDWWLQRMSLLATAYWTGHLSLHLEAREKSCRNLYRMKLQEELVWELDRLRIDESWLPGTPYIAPMQLVSELIRQRDPQLVSAIQRKTFHLLSNNRLTLQRGKTQIFNLVFKATRDLAYGEHVRLVLENPVGSSALRFFHDASGGQDQRIELPLDRKPGREYAGRVAVMFDPSAQEIANVQVWARVERSRRIPPTGSAEKTQADGIVEIDWFPLDFVVRSDEPPPAELVLKWEDEGAQSGRVDLYPNQSLPIRIGVRRNVTETGPLHVELLTGAVRQTLPLGDQPDEAGVVYLAPPPDLLLSIVGDRLAVRLYQAEKMLEERDLQVAVLDLYQCFDRRVTYDPIDQRFTAEIRRIHRSDVAAPVDFSLQLRDHLAEDGITLFTLKPNEEAGRLELRVPADARAPYRLAIAGSGVPRLYRYRFEQNQLLGQVESDLELKVLSPADRAKRKFKQGPQDVPVAIQLDGPRVIRYDVGVDLDRNGVLGENELQRRSDSWHGRDTSLRLTAAAEPPGFLVESQVSDILMTLDTSGLVGGQPVIVHAVTSSRSVRARVAIYALQALPAVKIGAPVPELPIPLGKPFEVRLQADPELFGAIDRVEFGFDLNGNAQLDEEELVLPVGASPEEPVRFSQSPRMTVSLPTNGLAAGTAVLVVRASTSVADPEAETGVSTLVSPVSQQKFAFVSTGRIAGVVITADGLPAKNVVVSVAGVGTTRSDADGGFRFEEVPAGEFEVIAETVQRIGRRAVKVEPGQSGVAEITILVK